MIGRLAGSIALQVGQRPSQILREEELIDDEPGLWNLLLDAAILSEVTPKQNNTLTGEIEDLYRRFGIRR
jgi:hypothetical protein